MDFDLTTVVTRFKEPSKILFDCLESLSQQKKIKMKVLVLDQFSDTKVKNKCKKLSNTSVFFVYIQIPDISLSFARNYGTKNTKNNFILFIDPDAIASPNWAHEMISGLRKKDIAIAGSRIIPKLLSKPNFLFKSNIIKEQYSLLDLGYDNKLTKRVIGASFGIDIEKLKEESYFDEKFGRKKNILLGGEEVDLCERALEKGLKVLYIGKTFVYHQIPEKRCKLRWILKRIYFGGISRSMRGGKPNPISKKRNFYDYLYAPIYLSIYLLGFIKYKLGKDYD